MAYAGPFCKQHHITNTVLLEGTKPMPCITAVTNGLVLELYGVMQQNKLTWEAMKTWGISLTGSESVADVTTPSLRHAVMKVVNHRKNLLKSQKKKQLDTYLKQSFSMPVSRSFASCSTVPAKSEKSTATLSNLQVKNGSHLQKISRQQGSFQREETEIVNEVNRSLAAELQEWRKMYEKEKAKNTSLVSKVAQYNPRNVKRRERRKDLRIQEQKKYIKRLEKNFALKKARKRTRYYQIQYHALKANIQAAECKYCASQESELQELRQRNIELQHHNASLRDEITELKQKLENVKMLETFENGKYTNELRMCIMELLSMNVSINNVNSVIKAVLRLTESECERLPKRTMITELTVEGHTLAQAQLAEALCNTENATLHSDGTSKFGHKYSGYQISTSTGDSYTLGLREMCTGSAQTTLDTLNEILADIEEVADKALGVGNAANRILANIKCTMSDRASTEKSFNDLLTAYRSEILPTVVDNWGELLLEQREAMARMYNFFCGMHFIVGMADHTAEALRLFEITHQESETTTVSASTEPTEAGCIRFIRTACKAFEKRGDQKSGHPLQFSSFLKQKGIQRVPLVHFKGNRFNIIFIDGGRVFFLRPYIIEFLTKQIGAPNRLLQAVLADAKEELYYAGCKALGLMNKFITCPLWRILESGTHILGMNDHYTRLLQFLQKSKLNACEFMSGISIPFTEVEVNEDDILQELLKPHEDIDPLVQQMLQAIFQALELLVLRMLDDHLKDGKWDKATEEMKQQTKSVRPTNTISERDFALLDRYIREKPNASLLVLEAQILFVNNKTIDWLYNKPESEKQKLLDFARRSAPAHRQKFRERQKAIEAQRAEALMNKQQQMYEAEQRALREKEKYTSDIVTYGLWQSPDDVVQKMSLLTKTKQKLALKAQLRFRKHVLQQKHSDKDIYKFSDKTSGTYSVAKLQENLLRLIQSAQTQPLLSNPSNLTSTLVGKRVLHYFNVDGKLQGFHGYVISQVPGFPEWYNIVYDEEGDIVSTYQLMDDYNSGDLELVDS